MSLLSAGRIFCALSPHTARPATFSRPNGHIFTSECRRKGNLNGRPRETVTMDHMEREEAWEKSLNAVEFLQGMVTI